MKKDNDDEHECMSHNMIFSPGTTFSAHPSHFCPPAPKKHLRYKSCPEHHSTDFYSVSKLYYIVTSFKSALPTVFITVLNDDLLHTKVCTDYKRTRNSKHDYDMTPPPSLKQFLFYIQYKAIQLVYYCFFVNTLDVKKLQALLLKTLRTHKVSWPSNKHCIIFFISTKTN